jgi:tetratricopeptide (TPR) repeat protein
MAAMMRPLVILILALAVWATAAQPPEALLDAAAAAYDAGDYAAAVAQYEQVLAAGVHDARVYHNLGNAYYESGDLGRALLNYHRALRLDPRRTDTSLQVSLVRGLRVDVQGDECGLLEVIAGTTDGILTRGELLLVAGLLWAGSFGVLTAYLVRRSEGLRYAAVGLGAAALIALALVLGRVYVEAARPLAVVVAPQVTVTSGPGTDFTALYTLYAAAELRIIGREGEWVQFALPDGRLGWMPVAAADRV